MSTSMVFSGPIGTLTVILRTPEMVAQIGTASMSALNRVVQLCVATAQGLVLRDTGHLANTIGPGAAEGGGGGQHWARDMGGGIYVIRWGADAHYAIYQEIGPVTEIRIWRFRPYLRPAADMHYPQLAPFIAAGLGL